MTAGRNRAGIDIDALIRGTLSQSLVVSAARASMARTA